MKKILMIAVIIATGFTARSQGHEAKPLKHQKHLKGNDKGTTAADSPVIYVRTNQSWLALEREGVRYA